MKDLKNFENYNFNEEWTKYCRTLYRNVLVLEARLGRKLEDSFRCGEPFQERSLILRKIEYLQSVKKQLVGFATNYEYEFEYPYYCFDVVDKYGYEFYFRTEGYPQFERNNLIFNS